MDRAVSGGVGGQLHTPRCAARGRAVFYYPRPGPGVTTMPLPVHVSTPSEREIVMTRSFAAPRQLVWDCHTRPELIRRWMLGPPGWAMVLCEVDLRVGG